MKDQLSNVVLELPLLALRGIVVLPNMSAHFEVGRKKSINAIALAMKDDKKICLVTQKDLRKNNPNQDDLYKTCIIATIKQQLNLSGENVRILIEGMQRGIIREFNFGTESLSAKVEIVEPAKQVATGVSVEALLREATDIFEEYSILVPKISPDVYMNILSIEHPGKLADYIAANIMLSTEVKQEILDELDNIKRLKKLIKDLNREITVLKLEKTIHDKVQEGIDKNQREFYLREQLKVIYGELGEGENIAEETEKYTKNIKGYNLSAENEEKLLKEVVKLSKMGAGSVEANVIRSYLDICIELPWNKYTKDKIVLDNVRKKLDKDHYGLNKVKDRIVEYLAVKKLKPDMKGQILCLVGPPGVGKTSIATSIANAIGRKFARISLGGIHDEAEIRGHRRTYIGSMPGRIIDAFKNAGSNNPLILCDEIDKMASDYKGDPASAMLEVLDAEQNHAFRDNYIELDFDISKAIFITTANTTETIPAPLLDRMELIELTSYTDEEKYMIATEHLIPKQLNAHGLTKNDLSISDGAVNTVITSYTRESGVRQLERCIQKICRKAAARKVSGEKKSIVLNENLEDYLGAIRFVGDKISAADETGVATGLAWTSVGGETLKIEVLTMEGSGKIQMTGSLGDVMKESVNAAISYIRCNYAKFGIDKDFYKNLDLHIHFPEGAIPKDGPSAGITITTAILSELSKTPVRNDIAMTGEITLKGKVLPIGGLNEKLCAAARLKIGTVLVPNDNRADVEEVDKNVTKKLNIVFVSTMDDVAEIALVSKENVENTVDAVQEKISGIISSGAPDIRQKQIKQ